MRSLFSLFSILFLFCLADFSIAANLPEKCRLIPDRGPCKAMMEKFYFNQPNGRCTPYFYDGCGKVVPFDTLDECRSLCEQALNSPAKIITPKHEPVQNTSTDIDVSHKNVPEAEQSASGKTALPSLLNHTFSPAEKRMLPGRTQETKMAGTPLKEDSIGRLAIVSLFYQNNCYTDGNFNHNNFLVEHGSVSAGSTGERFDAYRIHEPASKAKNFLASQHGLFYRFPTRGPWYLYKLSGNTITRVAEIRAERIQPERVTKIEGVSASQIEGAVTYFFVPARTRISPFTQVANGVEAAKVKQTTLGDIYKYRYNLTGTPADQLKQRSNPTRQFFISAADDKSIGLIWQDKLTKIIHLTRISSDLKTAATINLATDTQELLVAACISPDGNIFYATMTGGKGSAILTLYRSDSSGRLLAKGKPDTSASKLNIFNFANDIADMAWSKGRLGLIISRTMHKSRDGLNHQGAIAAIFDTEKLQLVKNLGQTSGHSFDNLLTVNQGGEFIGLDLGDNYPRGVNLHRIAEKGLTSRVVFTFKTLHGTTPESPANAVYPHYPEISTGEQSFFKWSNDNLTYSELGGLIETTDGYAAVFSGEPGPNGRALDNSRTGNANKDTRNIGLVRVVSDFDKSKGNGNIVTDDMVLTKGITESGGFYSFGGVWSEQRNSGVVWITNYRDPAKESAAQIKAVGMGDGSILIMWEKMAGSNYIGSYAVRVDKDGKVLTPPFELGSQVRLHRRDTPLVVGNNIYIVSGDATERKLELVVFERSIFMLRSSVPE